MRRYAPVCAVCDHRAPHERNVPSVLRDALIWYYTNRPVDLGGGTAGANGEPTEVEITDVQALNAAGAWVLKAA